jgi:hypothetical protein
MPIPIDSTGLGGTLQVNDDGSLTFTKDDHLKEEEMTVEQAVRRWPQLETAIFAALKRLPD